MKVRIANFTCPECKSHDFSLDKNRNHYTNEEKNQGYFISTKTCLNCGWKKKFNKIKWHSIKEVITYDAINKRAKKKAPASLR